MENCQCDATLLNFFQNTTSREYRIYSGIFVEIKIFSKYNITTSVEAFYDKAMLHYLEGMPQPCLKNVSLLSMEHCNKKWCYTTPLF